MPEAVVCPTCDAQCDRGDPICWLCRQPLPVDIPSAPAAVDAAASSFSLTSLMLVVTLVSVCLGLFVVAPGLGVLLSIASVPALARTAVLIQRRTLRGNTATTSDKVWLFVASMGGVMLAGVAASVAFFGACAAACFGIMAVNSRPAEGTVLLLLLVSGAAGLLVAWWVLRRLWKRRQVN